MKSMLITAALIGATPAFAASDVDIVPYGYVAQAMRATKLSAQAAARPAVGESGIVFSDAPAAKPRLQVIAETQEAARLGLLAQGEGDQALPNARQNEQIRQAGLRALGVHTASH
jgi:hypothetical protein